MFDIVRVRIWLSIAVLLLAGCGAAPTDVPRASAHPMRVMSINECTDQIVLALLPPERIASVTWLSRDPDISLMAARARRVAINHGQSEDVAQQRPDLVVANSFATPETRALLKRLGWPMIEVDDAETFDDIRRVTRQIAAAVDERQRGEILIARMDRQLANLRDDPVAPVRVAAWDGAGFSAVKGTLYDALLRAAGAINVANQPPASGYGAPSTEILLVARPDLLVRGGSEDRMSLRANVANHPLVRRYWAKDRSIAIPQSYYICGTPFIGDAALRLRQELRAAQHAARTPLPFQSGSRS
jgi:iron complex transport system substrate-binding protein